MVASTIDRFTVLFHLYKLHSLWNVPFHDTVSTPDKWEWAMQPFFLAVTYSKRDNTFFNTVSMSGRILKHSHWNFSSLKAT